MNETTQKIFAIVSLPIVIAAVLFSVMRHREQGVHRPALFIGAKIWTVEIADTEDTRSTGLSDRDSICKACGMLFRFDSPGEYAFWMKDMRFPLDFAWIREGKIISLEKDIPAGSSDIFTPTGPADSVLEVNAGDLSGVSVGDTVSVKE